MGTSLHSGLIAALQNLPNDWALTPVTGNKQPYHKNWQRKGMPRQHLIAEIRSNRAKGFGILTGVLSGGILAIDCDGEAAHKLLAKHGELPPTVAFTSGKAGRCQYLLRVSEEFWSAIKTTKLNSGVKGDDGKDQLLELRWDGCQSVLPPSVHPETGEYKWVVSPTDSEIAECPAWVIELILSGDRNDYPTLTQERGTRYSDITVPVPDSVPLEVCLSKESRDLLKGVSEGGRNTAGAKLARDLIGTANYLQAAGQAFNGDPRELFDDFASRCNPPLAAREAATIWKSAEHDRPTPSCRSEGVENSVKGWYWSNRVKSKINAPPSANKIGSNSNGINRADEPPYDDWLRAEIQSFIDRGITGSKLTAAIAKLAKSGASQQVIWRIYYEIAEEVDLSDNRDETIKDLNSFLKAKEARLDIAKILPQGIANPINKVAKQLGLRAECYLSVLLAVVSTLHRNNTWVRLWEATDFEVTPNLFVAIVADASQYKSPILKAIATKPLAKLQKEAKLEYAENLRQYEADLKVWEKDKEGEAPVMPARKIHYFTDSTSEGIVKQFSDRPETGLLNLVDELAGKFKSANQYRGGRGSDEEDLLSLYDGTGKVTLRAGGIKSDLEDGLNFGLVGSIQPKVLQKFLADCEDSNGNWARFIFVNQPLAMAEWNCDSGKIDLSESLSHLYAKVSRLPAYTYRLSPDAKEAFRIARNQAEKLRISDPRSGMRAYWGKVPGRIGKLAANLHVIHSLYSGEAIAQEIPLARVTEAISLCDFYAEQILSLYTELDGSDALPPKLAKILEIAKNKNGSVTLRDISRQTKWKSDAVRSFCDELSKMGRGQILKVGKALTFQLSPTVTTDVTSSVTVETITGEAFTPSVETVTKCRHFSESSVGELSEPIGGDDEHQAGVENQNRFLVTDGDSSTVAQSSHSEQNPTVTSTVTDKVTVGDICLSDADIEDFAGMIRSAIADPEVAGDIQILLSVFFAEHPGGRGRVWQALTAEERAAYSSLVKPAPKQKKLIDVPTSEENPKGGHI